jgi:hypothetical protein
MIGLCSAAAGTDDGLARPNLGKEAVVSKRFLWNGLKYGLGLGLLTFVLWHDWSPPASGGLGLRDFLDKPLQIGPLALTALIFVIGALLTFARWYVLVRAQELPFTPANALRLGLLGLFFSSFLPTSIGGDVIKAAFLAREQSRRTVAVATVLIDRAVGLWGIIWIVAVLGGLFWIGGNQTIQAEASLRLIILLALAVVGGTLGLWLVLGVLPEWRARRFAWRLEHYIPKVGLAAAEFWRAVWMYRCKGRSIVVAMVFSLASQVCFVLAFLFASHVFRDPEQPPNIPSVTEHFLLIPIGTGIQALFPSPGGVGGGEWGFGKLFSLVDPTMKTTGEFASLVLRAITLALGLIGYLIYLRMRPALATATRREEDAEELESSDQPEASATYSLAQPGPR